jgi:hypothetical protein
MNDQWVEVQITQAFWSRVAQSLVFCVVFCRSLYVVLSFTQAVTTGPHSDSFYNV